MPTDPPEFAFCERVTATAISKNHIRSVGPEGLKLGGGAPDTTLCGRPLNKGWDLSTRVSPDLVQMRVEWTCPDCAVAYISRVSAGTSAELEATPPDSFYDGRDPSW